MLMVLFCDSLAIAEPESMLIKWKNGRKQHNIGGCCVLSLETGPKVATQPKIVLSAALLSTMSRSKMPTLSLEMCAASVFISVCAQNTKNRFG